MAGLFDPLAIRDLKFANRVFVSPMCQYSSHDGYANDWHFVHLGSRAVGGAGLVLTEATAVLPEGRISPQDLGIWADGHIEMLARIVSFIHEQGSIAGMQLAHAGRKASTHRPWEATGAISESEGGWKKVVAPSALAFIDNYPMPQALTSDGIQEVVAAFAAAARRACQAGFRVLEIHAAHGYLIHEFLSPLSNKRADAYGGSFENRTRLCREIVAAVRSTWPKELPLFVRISSTDWIDDGWNIDESVKLAAQLKPMEVDLIDCSSGGNVPHAKIPVGPGYQVAFAERIRDGLKEAGGISPSVTLPDWTIEKWELKPLVYALAPHHQYSSYAFEFTASRNVQHYIWKVILPLVLIVIMSWAVFWITPTDASPQISIAVTSMLTLIAYRFAIDNQLPRLPYTTNLDAFILMSTVLVFFSFIEVLVTTILENQKRNRLAITIDRFCRVIFPVTFLLASMSIFVHPRG